MTSKNTNPVSLSTLVPFHQLMQMMDCETDGQVLVLSYKLRDGEEIISCETIDNEVEAFLEERGWSMFGSSFSDDERVRDLEFDNDGDLITQEDANRFCRELTMLLYRPVNVNFCDIGAAEYEQ
jgi:hypothetical protein